MTVVTIHKAKTELSRLLKRVEAGEEIIIARGNKPVAKLTLPDSKIASPRKPGRWIGRISFPDNIFEPLTEEELADWEGRYEGPP